MTDRCKVVDRPCDSFSISMPFYGHCTGTVRQPCNSRAGAVRSSQEPTFILRFFCSKTTSKNLAFSTRSPCDHREMPVRGIVRCSYDVSTGYVLTIFYFLYNLELNKIVEVVTILRRPKTVRYRTASVRRSHENGNLGIVRLP